MCSPCQFSFQVALYQSSLFLPFKDSRQAALSQLGDFTMASSFLPPAPPLRILSLRPDAPHHPKALSSVRAPSMWLAGYVRRTRRALARIPRSAFRPLRRRRTNNRSSGPPPPSSLSEPLAASALGHPAALPAPSRTRDPRTRVMLLISDTGGGHRASAQALSAAFDELYPGQVHALIVDFWTEIVGRPFVRFPEGYSFLAKNPPLWRAAWNYGRFPVTRRLTEEFANVVGNRNFRNALASFQPHLIVSVHPLTQFIPLRVLRTLPSPPPFVTVCTDLGGAHPTWFHRDVDLCFVPSDRVRKIAVRCGLKEPQLRQLGLPVRPAFWQDALDKDGVKSQLGLLSSSPTILVVGGGDGVGGVGRIARAVANRVFEQLGGDGAQIVVVCGKNKRLRDNLARKDWPVRVVVKGFVDNMSEWMTASDLIVSKAGPGTIAEALIRGLPIVLSGFLPGQEAPNVKYVTEAGVGAFSKDPETIADIVTNWVSDPMELAERSKRAKVMGRPTATYDIVREIAKLVDLNEREPLSASVV